MGSDILSKFLKSSDETPSAQNDDVVPCAFTDEEKSYIADLAKKYGVASRMYADGYGERIDIYMNRMEQQYNLPTLCLTKHPETGSPYKVIAAGSYGFVIPSNGFSSVQTALSRILMTHFQKQKLRSFDA